MYEFGERAAQSMREDDEEALHVATEALPVVFEIMNEGMKAPVTKILSQLVDALSGKDCKNSYVNEAFARANISLITLSVFGDTDAGRQFKKLVSSVLALRRRLVDEGEE